MDVLFRFCAGLDIHKKTVVACRVRTSPHGRIERETRTFGTTTRALLALLDWLREWGLTHVAMESTGEYWRPVWAILEGHLELLLVNPQHVKNVPGRKTDVQDAEWLAELLRHGLLKASFVPPQPQRELRDLTRGRTLLVEERARVLNRIQKVLEAANIKLASVVSDINGVSARAMLAALIAGESDPEVLAALARGRLQRKQEELTEALLGSVREHHRFLLQEHLTHLDFLDTRIAAFDAQIVAAIDRLSGPTGPAGPDDTADGDAFSVPARPVRGAQPPPPPSYAEAIALVLPIPGIARRIAEGALAEVGPDMAQYPGPGHLTSWSGLAPGNRQSGGKSLPAGTRHGNATLRKLMVQAAHGAIRTKGSYFGALYHRLAPRRGKKRAIVAVARSLLVVLYHVLRWREPYRELGSDYFDRRQQEHTANHLLQRLQKLGYEVSLTPTRPAAVPA